MFNVFTLKLHDKLVKARLHGGRTTQTGSQPARTHNGFFSLTLSLTCSLTAVRMINFLTSWFKYNLFNFLSLAATNRLHHLPCSLNNIDNLQQIRKKSLQLIFNTNENPKIFGKNMRYAHFAKKCVKVPNTRQSHIRVFLTCLCNFNFFEVTRMCLCCRLLRWSLAKLGVPDVMSPTTDFKNTAEDHVKGQSRCSWTSFYIDDSENDQPLVW